MKPQERYSWLQMWMSEEGSHVFADVLDSELVRAYVAATGASATEQPFGAPRCPQLGRDLSAMFAAGLLTRSRVGLPAGDAFMGFPKWVYSYSLAPKDTSHERAINHTGTA